MTKLSLSFRLYALAIFAVIILVSALWFSLRTTRDSIFGDRETLLASMDDAAIAILNKAYADAKAGKIGEDEAKKDAITAIGAIRYGENGYLWINDLNAVIVMHPIKPELNGTDQSGMKDPNGKHIFVEFAKTAKASGKGFVDYMWPKPGVDVPVRKLSHVALFEPWGWVVGNGVYIDDLEARMQAMTMSAVKIALGAIAAMALTAFFIIRSISGPVKRLKAAMARIEQEDFSAEIRETELRDEIGDLARGLVSLRDSVNSRVAERLAKEDEQRAEIERERQVHETRKAEQARNLSLVVAQLGAGLHRLAECNIRMTIDDPFAQEFESMRNDFNEAIAAFQKTLEEVLAATRLLQENGESMCEAASTMAHRTEQQAMELEQTSAALEQISANVYANSQHTQEARNLASETRSFASSSGDIVRATVDAMRNIETSASQIGAIIDVIDTIAFQTNLLALNAGVEAARAGDAGKGFAVVAQEVRELAQRTGEAARSIKSLTSQSAQAVGAGVSLVTRTGDVLNEIEGKIGTLDDRIEMIATASAEQAIGLRQITAAVHTIDQMTQQNAAMAQSTTEIGTALMEGSNYLASLVDRFKLNRRSRVRQPDDGTGPHMRGSNSLRNRAA